MIDEVLIATDGSDCGTRAARTGIELASTMGATAHVVVAADEELTAEAAATVADDVRELGAGEQVTVQTNVVEKRASNGIVHLADSVGADVIVLGRHGHSGLSERLLGSVTERVLRATDRAVLAVPEASGDVGGYSNVLLTSDGSEAAREAIGPAADVAAAYESRLHLLQVVDVALEAGPFNAGGVDEAYVDRLVDRAGDDLDVFAAGCEEALRKDAIGIEQAVRTGTPAVEIAEYVASTDVDLVAMASVGQGSLGGQLLGSTTERVLRTVDVPVLVVAG